MKAVVGFFYVATCSAVTLAGLNVHAKELLYDGLGSYSRKITTESSEAQRYFDQGLGFLHGFNHRAAIRAFQQAAELDPECAMAHWGVALACGPHINSTAVPPLTKLPERRRSLKGFGQKPISRLQAPVFVSRNRD